MVKALERLEEALHDAIKAMPAWIGIPCLFGALILTIPIILLKIIGSVVDSVRDRNDGDKLLSHTMSVADDVSMAGLSETTTQAIEEPVASERKPLERAVDERAAEETKDRMILGTTKGLVVIQTRPDLAPVHVERIKELVKEGFYDGIAFHRVIDGFMAQTGCPHGTGRGGSGKKLKAEFNSEPHVRGVVSMARAQDPNSGDSQFFICMDDATFLDGQYTVWGNVIEGMESVDKIKRGEPVLDPDKIVRAAFGHRSRAAPTKAQAIEPAAEAAIAGVMKAEKVVKVQSKNLILRCPHCRSKAEHYRDPKRPVLRCLLCGYDYPSAIEPQGL